MQPMMETNHSGDRNKSIGIHKFISLKMPHAECIQDAANDENKS